MISSRPICSEQGDGTLKRVPKSARDGKPNALIWRLGPVIYARFLAWCPERPCPIAHRVGDFTASLSWQENAAHQGVRRGHDHGKWGVHGQSSRAGMCAAGCGAPSATAYCHGYQAMHRLV